MDRSAKKTQWIIIAIAVIVVCGIGAFLVVRDVNGKSPVATSSATSGTSNTSDADSSFTPFTPASASPTPPTATDLEGYIPAEADGYTWEDATEDSSATDAGAQSASAGVFKSKDEQLAANLAQWPTEDQAAAYAQQLGVDENPDKTALVDGDINSGAGHYWYYTMDDSDEQGVIYWYFGIFSGKLIGDPYSVQEFFLGFPR